MLWQHVGDLWPLSGIIKEKWPCRGSKSGLFSVPTMLATRTPPAAEYYEVV